MHLYTLYMYERHTQLERERAERPLGRQVVAAAHSLLLDAAQDRVVVVVRRVVGVVELLHREVVHGDLVVRGVDHVEAVDRCTRRVGHACAADHEPHVWVVHVVAVLVSHEVLEPTLHRCTRTELRELRVHRRHCGVRLTSVSRSVEVTYIGSEIIHT